MLHVRIERWVPLILALVAWAGVAAADPTDERFLDGLRARRLFSLAESYCRERLAQADLGEMDRAELAIELARTLAQHALNTSPADRGPLWQTARGAVADFLRDHRENPRRLAVEVQDALTVLARGELARQEAELGAAGAPSLDEAREQLREAVTMLSRLEEQTAELLRGRNQNGRTTEGELTVEELSSLGSNIQYQLARAFRNQALCYEADSADRANSLTQAARKLDPLSRRETTDVLTWRARIDAVVCARLLGDLAAATTRLDALGAADLPVDIALAAHAERIRVELARGNLEAAQALVRLGREIEGRTLADLDYALLETWIALWQAAVEKQEPEDAKKWQEKAVQTVRLIELLHGPYWLRQAETLLARSAAASGSGNVELLTRAAENFYRRGELDDAIAQYEQAALMSVDAGDEPTAFDLWYKAAAIEHQRPRTREALRRFRDLAIDLPDQPRAAKAHLLAILNAATLARESTPPQTEEYQSLLQEHLEKWPQSSTCDQARWWLGRLRENQQAWAEALAAYRGISRGFPEYEDALRATARCWQQLLTKAADQGAAPANEATAAADWFETVFLDPTGQPPATWSPAQRLAALQAAKIRLTYTRDGFAAAKNALDAALQDASEAPDEWRAEAEMLQVVALAGLGRRDEATKVLQRLSGGQPERLMDLIVALRRLAADSPAAARRDLAPLQLEAITLVTPLAGRLSPPDRRTIQVVQAEALADAGNRDQALPAFERLAAAHPSDGTIQEKYAQLLIDSDDRETLQRALTQWRTVASRSPPDSDRWYRAKYGLALAYYRLGDHGRATDVIRYLETLHPELGGAELRQQFRELLALCQKRVPNP